MSSRAQSRNLQRLLCKIPIENNILYVSLLRPKMLKTNRDSLHTLLDSDIVSVKVGKNATTFTIHKGLLCRNSPFFTAACSERWKKAAPHDGEVILEKDSPQVFDIFRTYLYQGRLLFHDLTTEEMDIKTTTILAECGFFGDRVGCDGFRDAITNHYHSQVSGPLADKMGIDQEQWIHLPNILAHIWANTLPNNALRILWIKKFQKDVFTGSAVLKYPIEAFIDKWVHWPPEFAQDGFRCLAQTTRAKRFYVWSNSLPRSWMLYA